MDNQIQPFITTFRVKHFKSLLAVELELGQIGSDAIWVTVPSGLPVLKGLAVLGHHPVCITTSLGMGMIWELGGGQPRSQI